MALLNLAFVGFLVLQLSSLLVLVGFLSDWSSGCGTKTKKQQQTKYLRTECANCTETGCWRTAPVSQPVRNNVFQLEGFRVSNKINALKHNELNFSNLFYAD